MEDHLLNGDNTVRGSPIGEKAGLTRDDELSKERFELAGNDFSHNLVLSIEQTYGFEVPQIVVLVHLRMRQRFVELTFSSMEEELKVPIHNLMVVGPIICQYFWYIKR